MSIVLQGSTSGSITLQEPAIAGSNTINLPAATGTMALLQTPSFATTIGVGGATPSTSGAGITFPATQSASTDANTLDDYEEGTWTPTVGFGSTNATLVGVTGCTYTKIGRQVTCKIGGLTVSNFNGGTGNIFIGGLPFTNASSNGFSYGNLQISAYNSGNFSFMPYISQNSTTSRILAMQSTGHNDVTNANVSINFAIYGFFTYEIS